MQTVIEVDAITMVDNPDTPELTEVALLNVGTEVAKFDPVKQALSRLITEITTTVYDINTTAGEETARALRSKCVKIRTDGDRTYKMLNAPLLEVQRKWRDINASIPTAIKEYEDRLDADIKAVEAVREAEKQRKIKADQDRINALRAKITAIAMLPTEAAKTRTAAELRNIISSAQDVATILDEDNFSEFLEEATILHAEVSTQLAEMLTAATDREEQAERLAHEAAELELARQAQALAAKRATAIVAIRSYPLSALGMNSLELQTHIDGLEVPTYPEFCESLVEALAAYKLVVQQLQQMQYAAKALEKTAQEQKLAREQDEARRQVDAAAAEQRQIEAAAATKLLREQTDAFESEQAVARALLDAEAKRLAADRAAFARQGEALAKADEPQVSVTPEVEALVIWTGTALPPEVTLTPKDLALGRAARLVKLVMDEDENGRWFTELEAINHLLDADIQWALTERKLALEAKFEGVAA